MSKYWNHNPETCDYCKDLRDPLYDGDAHLPILGTDLPICVNCFAKYKKTENHDCFINQMMLPVPTDLERLWDTQHPDFTPFDDRPLSVGTFIKLQHFIDDQG